MIPELTELLLIVVSIESIWISKSKSNTSTSKKKLTDILIKKHFTRDEWNHLWCIFNTNHFSSPVYSPVMTKRAQQGSGEERVTAKSRPMMNLTARMPSVVSSSTSSNPGGTSYGYQDPGKSVTSDDRSGKPEKRSPPDYSKENYGQSWPSQEWKRGAVTRSIREIWEKLLGYVATSCISSWRTSSRRKYAFRTVRRDDSRWIWKVWDTESPRRNIIRKFRHGQWRSKICEQSKRPSAKQTKKNVERCNVM